MNGQLFLRRINTMPGQYQPNNFYLEADINELNRLRSLMVVRSQNYYSEDEIADTLSSIVALLTKLNSDSLTGIDLAGFTRSYIDTVAQLVEFCSQYIETGKSDKIASLRETIIKEGWNRFNALRNRQLYIHSDELKAYEFFSSAGSLENRYRNKVGSYGLYPDQEQLDQFFMSNKQYCLSLFSEHSKSLCTDDQSILSKFMTPEFSTEVELYKKLSNL